MDISKIFCLPTPVQQIHIEELAAYQIQLYIKRDDLIHPIISGNKWRKLKYTVALAQQMQKKTLVSFGGAYSNHLLALSCAAQLFGLKSVGFVRGEAVNNPILEQCALFGMQLHFVTRTDYKNKNAIYTQNFGQNTDAMFIDEGGASQQALLGVSELVHELHFAPDYLFLGVGTGTTLAGVALGLQQRQFTNTQLVGILALKAENFIVPYQTDFPFLLKTDYHCGGYAKKNDELINLAQSFLAQTGIKLDLVYNAKCLLGLIGEAKKGNILPQTKVLMLHTGGFGLE